MDSSKNGSKFADVDGVCATVVEEIDAVVVKTEGEGMLVSGARVMLVGGGPPSNLFEAEIVGVVLGGVLGQTWVASSPVGVAMMGAAGSADSVTMVAAAVPWNVAVPHEGRAPGGAGPLGFTQGSSMVFERGCEVMRWSVRCCVLGFLRCGVGCAVSLVR